MTPRQTPGASHPARPKAGIQRRAGRDHNGLFDALQPIDLLFEFGDRWARGHGVFAIRSISAVNRSTSASG
jgi:hypothetical protein